MQLHDIIRKSLTAYRIDSGVRSVHRRGKNRRPTCEPFIDDCSLLRDIVRSSPEPDEQHTIISIMVWFWNSGGTLIPCAIAARIYAFLITECFVATRVWIELTVSMMPDALGFPSTRTGFPWIYLDSLSSSAASWGLCRVAAAKWDVLVAVPGEYMIKHTLGEPSLQCFKALTSIGITCQVFVPSITVTTYYRKDFKNYTTWKQDHRVRTVGQVFESHLLVG